MGGARRAIPISQIMAREEVMGIAPFRALHSPYALENAQQLVYNHSIEQTPKRARARKGISAMPVTHEPWLVALSLIVAIQGAYVGLSLAVQVAGAIGLRRRLLLAGAAISLAVTIWSMHFVGMLAARLPLPVDYLVFPTLLSFLVCVLVVGAAVFAASAGPPTPLRLAGAACGMGTGIVTMHYIGMSALHASAHMDHAPLLVAAAMAIAIATSGLALWLAEGRDR